MVSGSASKSPGDILAAAHAIREGLIAAHPQLAARLRRVHITTSTRMTRSAGNANYVQDRIKLSVPFFSDGKNFEEHLENTVKHELAHLLSGRGSGHGPAWRAMLRRLGGAVARTHDMELAREYAAKRPPRVEVACGRCGGPLQLGPRQAQRHGKGARYAHRRCPGD